MSDQTYQINNADEYNLEPTAEHLPKQPVRRFSGKPLADFLLHRRVELGLSLAQLETRTGIHMSRLNRWERGEDHPGRPERLTALAQGLEVPAADLYLLAGMDLAPELP